MRNRILPIFISIFIATFAFIIIEQVLATSELVKNTGITVDEAESVTITDAHLLVTDTVNAANALTYTILTTTQNGLLSGAGQFTQQYIDDGFLTYTHDGQESTSDSFDFNVTNGISIVLTSTFTITINPINDPPSPVIDVITMTEGATATQLSIPLNATSVLSNDIDAENDTLTASISPGGDPLNAASFNLSPDGTFSYAHDGSETITDTFKYTVCDNGTPQECTNTGKVNINIIPVNDAPVAVTDVITVAEGGTTTQLTIPNANSVLFNDTDAENDDLTVTLITTPPAHAKLNTFELFANGTFSYIHDGSETTSDFFGYRICDNGSPTPACSVSNGQVIIHVTPVNDAPIAVTDTLNLDEGAGKSLNVIANDSDDDSDKINFTLTISDTPSYGNAVIIGNHSITYTHDGSETTTDSLTYEICDDGTPQECDTAVVNITINPINDTPIPTGDSFIVTEGQSKSINVLTNDNDAENDTLTASIVISPAHASSYSLSPAGLLNYTHDGSETTTDSIQYRVCDDGSPSKCATAFVNITISDANDPPTAVPDTFYLAEGTSVSGNVKTNDYDAESDPFVVITTPTSPPSHAINPFSLNANGNFTYQHDGSETTLDNFIYRVCITASSPLPECTETSVTLVITPTNDAPTTAPDTFIVPRSTTLNSVDYTPGPTTVIANDTDAEGDNLTVNTTPVTPPSHASSFTLNANGTFIYTHDDLSDNPDSFTYRVCDDGSPQKCSNETVTITIGERPTTFIYLPTVLYNYSADEPNDSPCTAYPLDLNKTYSFAPNDIEDWYRITLPSATNLSLQVNNFVLDGDLIVYQSTDCVIDSSDQVKNDGASQPSKTVNWNNAPAGTYYIRVYTANPSLAAINYSLTINAP